ncbi:3-dehydroquinate dehydratase [subsurface metagenome]
MKYKICIAIPIKSDDLNINRQLVETSIEKKPDLIEFRFDYINDVKFITFSFLTELLNLITPKIPIVFTFRRIQERGQYDLNKNEHLQILKLLVEVKPDYLDIEMKSDIKILKTITNLAYKNNVDLIFSFHDFEDTPTYEETITLLDKFEDKLIHECSIDLDKMGESVFKLIFTPQIFEDNLNILKICRTLSQDGKKIVCFAMGELGIFSRIMCVKFGSLWTYGSLRDKTAPGQININTLREMYQLLFNSNS